VSGNHGKIRQIVTLIVGKGAFVLTRNVMMRMIACGRSPSAIHLCLASMDGFQVVTVEEVVISTISPLPLATITSSLSHLKLDYLVIKMNPNPMELSATEHASSAKDAKARNLVMIAVVATSGEEW